MRKCGLCGVPGHYAKSCNARTPKHIQPPGGLTERQYSDVQLSRDHGMRTDLIARLSGWAIQEVNYAYCSPSFELYLRERRVRRRAIIAAQDADEPLIPEDV